MTETKKGLILAEGIRDVNFIARILKFSGFSKIQMHGKLDDYWKNLVPTQFPHDDDLLKRVPVPLFMKSPNASIACHQAGGIDALCNKLRLTLRLLLDANEIEFIGVFLDADKRGPAKQFEIFEREMRKIELDVNFEIPSGPGKIAGNGRRFGVFIFPDNESRGALEEIMLECGVEVYPELIAGAKKFVAELKFPEEQYTKDDLEDYKKPYGKQKAIVGCIGSVLKPSTSLQVSIDRNRWISEPTLDLPKVAPLKSFLERLIG